MIGFVVQQKGKTGQLTLSGPMGIDQAPRLREALTFALEQVEDVQVEVAGVEGLSLAVAQVLISAHKTARAQKRVLRLASTPPESMASVLMLGGFWNENLEPDVAADTLWLKGTNA